MLHPVVPALVAMLAVQILVSMSGTTGSVVAPMAAPDFGVPTYMVGVYVGVIYGTGAVSSACCAGFIGRFGPLRISQICLLLCAGGLALGASGSLSAALLGAFIIGVAYGPSPVSSSHVLARLTPPRWMNLVFSLKQTGVPLGTGLSGLLMPVLALSLGWQGAALIGAAICVTVAALLQPMRASLDHDRDPRRPLLTLSNFVGPVKLALGTPALRRLSLISFAYAGMQTILSAFLVTYLADRLATALVLAGMVLALSQGVGAAFRVLWGWVADRYIEPVRLLALLGLAMSLMALATAAFTPDWPWLAVLAVCSLFGGTAAGWNGVFLAQLARMAPPGRVGELAGGASFVTFGGVMVLPPLFSGILALSGSYTLGFAFTAALTCAGGLWLFLPLKPPPPAPEA